MNYTQYEMHIIYISLKIDFICIWLSKYVLSKLFYPIKMNIKLILLGFLLFAFIKCNEINKKTLEIQDPLIRPHLSNSLSDISSNISSSSSSSSSSLSSSSSESLFVGDMIGAIIGFTILFLLLGTFIIVMILMFVEKIKHYYSKYISSKNISSKYYSINKYSTDILV